MNLAKRIGRFFKDMRARPKDRLAHQKTGYQQHHCGACHDADCGHIHLGLSMPSCPCWSMLSSYKRLSEKRGGIKSCLNPQNGMLSTPIPAMRIRWLKTLKSGGKPRLHDLIHEVKIPTETVVEVKDNKSREVERKIFPGYVLVKMVLTDDSWYVVRNTRGCTGFIGPVVQASPLTDAEVEALGVETKQVEVTYAVGDSVKIIEGPLEGFVGTVDSLDRGRICAGYRFHVWPGNPSRIRTWPGRNGKLIFLGT